jgi:sialic acid synthase SpsE
MKNIHELIRQHKTLFLPDIGTFFNDDIEIALGMVDKLGEANIPVIKAEILHDVDICLQSDLSEFYYSPSKERMVEENYRDIIERKVVSLDSYEKIFSRVKKRGCELVVSVYDNKGVDFAIEQDVIAIKIASSNITHQPLLEYVAKTDKSIMLDTGHSTLEEIARAVNWLNDAGKLDIIIQHSPLAPPISVEEHNLKFMQTLGRCFGIPYGLSDHHIGDEMLYAATALGASIVEKGVCPDELGDEQDRAHALNISDVATVQNKISNIAKGLGSGVRQLDRRREKYRSRMGLVARQEITEGTVLTYENIGFAFPAVGLGVEYIDLVLGKEVKRSISIGQPIHLFYL